VALLLHPNSPVTRLLIDHPTGSGKTREMIRVLDNFFHDPRPKVPVFPRNPVCRNFYSELLRWPNRYRDYFCCERPADAAITSGRQDWQQARSCMWDLSHLSEEESRRLGYAIREVLEMKNMFYMGRMRLAFRADFERRHPAEQMPAAPMRALSYTSAGGTYTRISEQGQQLGLPASALMKVGYERGSGNVYSNKVVIMDEVHNLVRTHTQYAEQLQCLRDLLFRAGNLVLGGFTGTPILSEPAEGRQLLDIVKGQGAAPCDEGFLSSFPMRPRPLFPLSLPRGVPDAVLTPQLQRQLVCRIELREEALRAYERKRRLGLNGRRLRAYCNVSAFFGSFHDGKSGTKERILADPAASCPKLYKIAQDVAASAEKALVLVSRQTGYIVMLELMRLVAMRSETQFAVATIDDLAEFNHVSNLRGQKFRVLVADSAQCSEGVSFFAVRRTFLADVPTSPSQFIQQCGRAIRMYGHRGLPDEEQTVTNRLYIATFPHWVTSELACWSLRAQRRDMTGKDLEASARALNMQLQHCGITSLSQLKAQIDDHGSQKRRSLRPNSDPKEKALLTTKDMTMFLELSGLWEDGPPNADSAKAEPASVKRLADAGATAGRSVVAKKAMDFTTLASGSERLAALSSRVGLTPGMSATSSILSSKEYEMDEAESVAGCAPSPDLDTSAGGSQHILMSQEELGSQGASSTQGMASSSRDPLPKWAPRAAAGIRHPLQHLDKAEFALLSTALGAARTACEDAAGTASASSSWLAAFDTALREIRHSRPVLAALRAALPRSVDVQRVELRSLSAAQVRAVRDHLAKAHGLTGLTGAVTAVRAACDTLGQVSLGGTEDWRGPLEEALEGLGQCGKVQEALEAAVPGRTSVSGEERLTAEQLPILLGELSRRRAEERRPSANSRHALVRAAQDLYCATSLREAANTLSPETVDEEALRQLAERTQEFSTALAVLRSQAVDRELFAQLVNDGPTTSGDDGLAAGKNPSEDDQSAGSDDRPAKLDVGRALGPVRLPPGWKLTWEMRRKSEAFLIVDPRGKRYSRVADLRAALQAGTGQAGGPAAAGRQAAAVGLRRSAAGSAGGSRPTGGAAGRRQRRKARW